MSPATTVSVSIFFNLLIFSSCSSSLQSLFANRCMLLQDESLSHVQFLAETLEVLELRCTPLTDAGLVPLLRSLRVLKSVSLDDCSVGNMTLRAITHSSHLQRSLSGLSLTGVRNIRASALSHLPKLANLTFLNLELVPCVTGRVTRWLKKSCGGLVGFLTTTDLEDDGDDDWDDFEFEAKREDVLWCEPPIAKGVEASVVGIAKRLSSKTQNLVLAVQTAIISPPNSGTQPSEAEEQSGLFNQQFANPAPILDEEASPRAKQRPPPKKKVESSVPAEKCRTKIAASRSSLSFLGCSMPRKQVSLLTMPKKKEVCFFETDLNRAKKLGVKKCSSVGAFFRSSSLSSLRSPTTALGDNKSLLRPSSFAWKSTFPSSSSPRLLSNTPAAPLPLFAADPPRYSLITSAKPVSKAWVSSDTKSLAVPGRTDGEDECEVECIIAIIAGARRPYRVRWRGLGPEMVKTVFETVRKRVHFFVPLRRIPGFRNATSARDFHPSLRYFGGKRGENRRNGMSLYPLHLLRLKLLALLLRIPPSLLHRILSSQILPRKKVAVWCGKVHMGLAQQFPTSSAACDNPHHQTHLARPLPSCRNRRQWQLFILGGSA